MTNINTSLQEFAVGVESIEPHPTNPRRGNVEAIKESLTRFGQVRPIIVQESTGYVVAGNHTLRAARELGWKQIAAVNIDMPDDEAEAYLVADNRLSDLGDYDNAVLAPLLERMMLAGRLEGTGYSPDDVDDMLSAMNALPEVDPGETEAQHADSEEIQRRFANRTTTGPQRQFVLLYDQGTGQEVEQLFAQLKSAWGMERTIDVALEALRRAASGLSDEEQTAAVDAVADADADVEVHSPQTGEVTQLSTVPPEDENALAMAAQHGFAWGSLSEEERNHWRGLAREADPDAGFDDGPGGQQTQFDDSDTADAQEDQAREEPHMIGENTAAAESLAEQEGNVEPMERTQPTYRRVDNVEAGRNWQDSDRISIRDNDDGSITLVNLTRSEVTRDDAKPDTEVNTFGEFLNARSPI